MISSGLSMQREGSYFMEIRPRILDKVFDKLHNLCPFSNESKFYPKDPDFMQPYEEIATYLKEHPEITKLTVLDLPIFNKCDNVQYGFDIYTSSVDQACMIILKAIEDIPNIVHLDLTSDWKVKFPFGLEKFLYELNDFVKVNKTLKTISLVGIQFKHDTEEKLRNYIMYNGQIKLITDFSEDIKCVNIETITRPFGAQIFGTNMLLSIEGNDEVSVFNNMKLVIIYCSFNEHDKTTTYKFASENVTQNLSEIKVDLYGNIVETWLSYDKNLFGNTTNLLRNATNLFRITKENNTYMCEISHFGKYTLPVALECIVPLSKFYFEVIKN